MILPKARKRNTRPEEDALHEVVMHLRLRAIRGLWTGFNCSEFESVCGDAVLVELARGENNYILVADQVVAFQARHKIVDFLSKNLPMLHSVERTRSATTLPSTHTWPRKRHGHEYAPHHITITCLYGCHGGGDGAMNPWRTVIH